MTQMADEKTRGNGNAQVGGKGANGSKTGKSGGHYEGAKTIMKGKK
jgi:hypothetical protein